MPVPRRKLRFDAPADPFHVVLVEPEIPQNTGSIGRLCAATGSRLHLVGRLGFDISEKAVRRAGMDYWRRLGPAVHESFERYLAAERPGSLLLMSSRGGRSHLEMDFAPGAALVFGSESRGLDEGLLEEHPDRTFAIPTVDGIRSLNLATAVAVVLYEALRATGALSRLHVESVDGGATRPRSR